MTQPDAELDADVALATSSGNLDAAVGGIVVLLLMWPVFKIARTLRRRVKRP